MLRLRGAQVLRGVVFGAVAFGAVALLSTAVLAADPQLPPLRGIAYPLVGTNGGLNQAGYKTTQTIIDEVKALGANTIRVTVTGGIYDNSRSNATNKTVTAANAPTDAELLTYLRALKAAGLRVYLIPFVSSLSTGDILEGTQRAPTDMAAFMADHTANMVRYARIAQEAGADYFQIFMDDTEVLVRDHANKAYWLELIRQVRAAYTGPIVAAPGASGQIFNGAATHYELMPREIFDAVDIIGCTCAYIGELTPTDNPSQLTLLNGYRGANNRVDVSVQYEYINRIYMKPVMLVDTSYHSFDGSNRLIVPIYNEAIPLTVDQQEQADLFQSSLTLIKEQKDKDWFMGILYSGQNALPAGAQVARFLKSPLGEDIAGKLAEPVVRNWYTGALPDAAQTISNASGDVSGGNGDDTITVTGTGTRTIDGGRGSNTVVINGNSSAYTITGDFQTAQLSGAALQLSLRNIHHVRFADADVRMATGGNTLSLQNGVRTFTGSASNDLIATGAGNSIVNTGAGGNDVVVADPWYQTTVVVPASRPNGVAYGRDGARLVITVNPSANTRWISAVGVAKLQFNDGEVTLPGDTVAGTALQTHLYGSPANDTFTTARTADVTVAGSAGNDSINGGSSNLTVTYPEPSTSFQVSTAAGVTTVVKPNGTDTIRNVKYIKFTDQTLSFVANTNGTTHWLGPVFSSASTEAQSFIRVDNTGTTSGTVTATIRNAETGQTLGQWISPVVQPGSSQQFLINTIETALPAGQKPAFYAMSLNSGVTGYLQHVLYRPADGTLTNLSTCDAGVTANPTELINVHSTILDFGFPSTVAVNNTGSTAASATLGIYDSRNGTKFGTYTTPAIAAGGQGRVGLATIESALGINPGTTIYHYNIKLEGAFSGFLQHLVNNKQRAVITDMTTVCRLGAPTTSTVTTPRVPSVFSSSPGTSQSFLRFYNTGTSAGTVKVSLVNDSTGTAFGEWTSASIPAGAARQVQINEIENAITPAFTKPTMYSLVAQPQITGFVQHVLYRPADGTLTNLSTCNAGVTANSTQLINVHSTLLDFGFPSTVVVANTAGTAASVTLGVYDSNSGVKLGTYTSAAVPANGQANIAVAAIEAAANVNPGTAGAASAIYQYNIKIEGAFTGFLQHLVNNKAVGVITDMTTLCRLN